MRSATYRRTTRDLRRTNRHIVLQQIYFARSTSRLGLSQCTGLSPATVTNVVAELLDEGVVVESGFEESSGGRPRAIIALNPAYGYFVGIDVGETHIQVELFDLTMHNLGAVTHSLAAEENQPQQVVIHIVEEMEALLVKSGVERDKVLGVGIGMPGLVERLGGVSVFTPNWGWHNVPLLAMLKKHINLPIYLDNGAKAMALAEMWFGAGWDVDNLAVLLIGTGVGAAIVTQGKLFRGITNSAGEWGHTTIELDGRECRCGSRGCLEAYVGAPGIIQSLCELNPQSEILDGQIATITAIVEAARRGDPAAIQVMDTTAHYLGAGVANLINLFNPQLIVLGGWAGLEIGEYILPGLGQFVARYALQRPLDATTISLSQLGQDAISMGAACLVLGDFLGSDCWQGPHTSPDEDECSTKQIGRESRFAQ
jgi:glucokinase-like ROK family protein